MKKLGDGGYAISDRFDISGAGSGFFVFARGWLLEIVEIESGEYFFISDGQEIRPRASRFGVFYPAFSLLRSSVRDVKGVVRGIGSIDTSPGLPERPTLFETGFDGELSETSVAAEVIQAGTEHRAIDLNTSPSIVTRRAKRLIDQNYAVYPSIGRIADRLKVTHAHLSRQFKSDLGLTPSEYLHQLRVADATFRLSLGEEIIDISGDVGYNDLSRFYKQFRKKTATSPAKCRLMFE